MAAFGMRLMSCEVVCANALMLNSRNTASAVMVNVLTKCDMDPPRILLKIGALRLMAHFDTFQGHAKFKNF